MLADLDELDDEQREAVLAARGPVCVLAGAGTGKTRTITRRIAHLVTAGHVAASQVLAVTFTQRAAGEMRSRLRALDDGTGTGSVQAMTFHAAARRQLHYFWPRVVGDTGWQLLDSKFSVVAQSASRAGLQRQHRRRPGPGGRNRMGEGVADQPGGLRRRRRRGRPRHPAGRGQGGRRVRRLRDDEGPRRRDGAARLRRPAAAHRRRDRERRGGGGGVPRPVPLLRRRRVPGRHPATAAGARRLAG